MWRLRGCHVGRLEEDEGRLAGTDGGRRRRSLELVGTSSAKGRRTGVMIRTRGIKPSARMHRKWLDGEESRQRTPATAKEGKGDGTTRDRFLRARASTRPRDCIPSTGLGGATPREAGDERRLAAASGNGGDATPGGGKGLGGARELLGGRVVTTTMTAGRFGVERRQGRQTRAQARQALTAAATGRFSLRDVANQLDAEGGGGGRAEKEAAPAPGAVLEAAPARLRQEVEGGRRRHRGRRRRSGAVEAGGGAGADEAGGVAKAEGGGGEGGGGANVVKAVGGAGAVEAGGAEAAGRGGERGDCEKGVRGLREQW
uniref:Epstein-Barr virus EBNA-1-like n=1 Tax=Oryza sativa subsp. japonica TaxID=39947 RepID=Q5VPR3_ORYSJ|nr:Epstein-Barr virus EBNA-1-like [Oryza sativa Japonica Group]BAD68562.1 Epstein-Barr virus EBNA-1-like [Oryza sativa Japonica Group]